MSLKKFCRVLSSVLVLSWAGLILTGMSPPPQNREDSQSIDIEVFVRKGCPHCEAAKGFLEKLGKLQPALHIVVRDVGVDDRALSRLLALSSEEGIKTPGVPSFFVRGELIVGYSTEETTGTYIRKLLEGPPPEDAASSQTKACMPESLELCSKQPAKTKQDRQKGVFVPGLGYRSLTDLGLPLFTLLLGLIDGFNPCAMWVLLFLLSLLATLRDRKKMFLLAGSFVAASGIVYFAFMAAWLNVFLLIGFSRLTQIVLGGMALVVGGVNLKDVWAFGRGPSLHIADSVKPGLYERLRKIIQAENLKGAIVGIITLAVVVACTAGFPALYAEILTLHQLNSWGYYAYLGLYNLAYIADDALITCLAVITLSHRKLQEREGRWLKGVGGVIMLGLGIVLIGNPSWLL